MKEMTEEAVLDAVDLFERDRTASPELAEALRMFAERSDPSDPLVGTAVWALGKRFDAGLKPFFIAMLERTYKVNPDAGFQCMIALDNLDEDILPEGGSVGETERNIRLAESYLKRTGTQHHPGA